MHIVALPISLEVKKSVSKPLPRLYPQKLETIGDHLRTKRLELGLRQKDLTSKLQACAATILNWEKNHRDPQPHHVPLICDFIGYCPILKRPVKHFGHQLRNYRIFSSGKSLFEQATVIGIDPGTLSEIEQSNTIRHTHVLNTINRFLRSIGWQIPSGSKTEFIPVRVKCTQHPTFQAPNDLPKTLGEHIALKRKQLNLTQAEVMEVIGVISASAYRSWEKYGVTPNVKYYPKIMSFLGYCPVRYSQSVGERLTITREHKGLSYRQVDKMLNLTIGCTYRAESLPNTNTRTTKKLLHFYRNYHY